MATPDTTSTPNLMKPDEPQKQITTVVDTDQLMAPAPEVPDLQPFIMQILAAQQQMMPKPSA